MVADTGSAGLWPPVGHEDHARLDELEAVEELFDPGHRPELRPADAPVPLLRVAVAGSSVSSRWCMKT